MIKSKGSIMARRFRERVSLYNAPGEKTDDYGYPSDPVPAFAGEFDADVQQVAGTTLLFYQRQGYTHPLTIRMRRPQAEFNRLEWNGSHVEILSLIPDPENRDCIIITGNCSNGKPDL